MVHAADHRTLTVDPITTSLRNTVRYRAAIAMPHSDVGCASDRQFSAGISIQPHWLRFHAMAQTTTTGHSS